MKSHESKEKNDFRWQREHFSCGFSSNTHTQSSQKGETVFNVDVVVAMYEVVWDLSLLLSEAEYELQHWRALLGRRIWELSP